MNAASTSKKRLRIAIDIDDVLADHVESFVEFSNKFHGTNLKPEDYDERWDEIWRVDNEEIERRAKKFHVPENVAAFAVKKESIVALKKLSGHFDLFIVTARKEHLIDITRAWINQYFPNTFKGMHFVPIWEPGNTITKADICKQIGVDYLIDDLASHCNGAAEVGIKAILFGNYSWNRNKRLNDGTTRCQNWDEVLAYFQLS